MQIQVYVNASPGLIDKFDPILDFVSGLNQVLESISHVEYVMGRSRIRGSAELGEKVYMAE